MATSLVFDISALDEPLTVIMPCRCKICINNNIDNLYARNLCTYCSNMERICQELLDLGVCISHPKEFLHNFKEARQRRWLPKVSTVEQYERYSKRYPECFMKFPKDSNYSRVVQSTLRLPNQEDNYLNHSNRSANSFVRPKDFA